ncbi:MAG: glycoside hydrolase, partial [Bacteroidales bacterium]|nr:glycoside hydrolase [Bacteroidales bacterium]
PEFSQFKELPAWGFWIRHAENVTFKNVKLSAAAKDYRPAVVIDDVVNSDFRGIKATAPGLKGRIFQAKNCKNIKK